MSFPCKDFRSNLMHTISHFILILAVLTDSHECLSLSGDENGVVSPIQFEYFFRSSIQIPLKTSRNAGNEV